MNCLKDFKKILRVYLVPLTIFLICILIADWSLKIYWQSGGELKDVYRLATESTVTFLAAFAGIFVPILINRNLDAEKDRRTLAFTLGLTWHELLYNEWLLKELQGNLNLKEVITFQGVVFIGALHSLKSKVDSLNYISDMLSYASFTASQNSGAIKTYNNDELFNSVIETYQAIQDVKFQMRTFQGNASKNSFLLNNIKTEKFDAGTESKIKDMIKKDIDSAKNKAGIALSKANSVTAMLDSALNQLGVKLSTNLM